MFAVRGDFNGDGAPDIALAGIDEGRALGDRVFVAILTKKRNRWAPDFFFWPKTEFAGLDVKLHAELTGQDGTPLPLDPRNVEIVIYWDRSRYRTVSGFELGD